MSQDDVTMTKAQFQTILRLSRAEAWDEGYKDCFLSLDGSGWRELEDNPYRLEGDAR